MKQIVQACGVDFGGVINSFRVGGFINPINQHRFQIVKGI